MLVFLIVIQILQSMDASESHYGGDESGLIPDTIYTRSGSIRYADYFGYEDKNKNEAGKTDKRINYSNIETENEMTRHIKKRNSDIIKQFKNYEGKTETNLTGQHYCSSTGSCNFNANKSHPVCYCDEYCSVFKDCCFGVDDDVKFAAKETEHYIRLLQYAECYRNELFYGTDKSPFKSGYYVIQVCPSNFTDPELIRKCQFSNFTQPVTSDHDGMTYTNEYCALCHNVTKYRHWNTVVFRFYCRRLDVLSMNETGIRQRLDFFKKHCDWKFVPAEGSKPRVCRNVLHSDTNSCPEFLNPVLQKTDSLLHRNYLCIQDVQKSFKCITPEDISLSGRGFGSHAITVMFQMHPPMIVGNTPTCQTGETYHEDSVMCFPDDCEGWNLDGQCNIEAFKNHEITAEFWFKSEGYQRVDSNLALRAISALHAFIPTYYDIAIARIWGVHCCGILQTMTTLKIKRKLSLANIARVLSNLQKINFTYHEMSNDSYITLRRINTSSEAYSKFMAEKHNSTLIRYNHVKFLGKILAVNISSEFKAIPTDLEVISNLQLSSTTGTLIKMTIHDVSYEYKNDSNDVGFEYKVYLPGLKTTGPNIQGTLTYICMCVSCTSLVTIIGLYIYAGMYKSAPGKLSIHMMTCLLLSQIFFMGGMDITDKGYNLCLTLGILSHYLWLTSFVWIFLFMVHITKTIVRVNNNPNGLEIYHVSLWNYVFGYGSAWLIVIPSIFLELCQCSAIDIGYTSNVCFPTGYPGNLFVFTGPVLLCLLINCFMLVANIIYISRYHSSVRSNSFNLNTSYLVTYVKLCFISSCPWLIGFLGELLQSDILKYIFVLLSGSHGFIVSLCFLCSKRIMSIFQRRSSFKSNSKIADTRL